MFLLISKNHIYMCSQIPFYRRESTATLMYHLPNRCFLLCYFYCEELVWLQIGNRLGDRHNLVSKRFPIAFLPTYAALHVKFIYIA